ncbi:MAG: tRNA (guanosine(46)-N7)-methyltransferase TrmB [Candidatus Omnitrophica bacterium]|nr:tRNA (guanosine(46)-N7)-methyltransferase TrmB [Candidatus Omnitrophota bacterium]
MSNISKTDIDKFLVSHFYEQHPVDWDQAFKRKAPLFVEIGFGNGEYLVAQAQKYPNRNFIGIEIEFHLIKKILKRIKKTKVENIRLLCVDAYVAFDRLFKNKSITYTHSLFPFPWPKKRHHKKRLFHKNFLKIVNSRLKKDGKFQVVTDFEPYFEWILEQAKNTGFKIEKDKVRPQFNTRFERLWSNEGQNSFFSILLTKTKHADIPINKQAKIKPFSVPAFNPDQIPYKNKKSKNLSIVFKQFSFDKSTLTGIQSIVVAEPHLTQLFNVVIKKKGNQWQVSIENNPQLIKTVGIKESLEIIKKGIAKVKK